MSYDDILSGWGSDRAPLPGRRATSTEHSQTPTPPPSPGAPQPSTTQAIPIPVTDFVSRYLAPRTPPDPAAMPAMCLHHLASIRVGPRDVRLVDDAVLLLTPRGMRLVEDFAEMRTRALAARRIQGWWRGLRARRVAEGLRADGAREREEGRSRTVRRSAALRKHLHRVSVAYQEMLAKDDSKSSDSTPSLKEIQFMKLLNSEHTFRLSSNIAQLGPRASLPPTSWENTEQLGDDLYAEYSPRVVGWISAVLDRLYPPKTELIDILITGTVLCELSVKLFPRFDCQLLNKGPAFTVHKVIFFLELCKTVGIKPEMLFAVSDLLAGGIEDDPSRRSALTVLRTVCAFERQARRRGWEGPSIFPPKTGGGSKASAAEGRRRSAARRRSHVEERVRSLRANAAGASLHSPPPPVPPIPVAATATATAAAAGAAAGAGASLLASRTSVATRSSRESLFSMYASYDPEAFRKANARRSSPNSTPTPSPPALMVETARSTPPLTVASTTPPLSPDSATPKAPSPPARMVETASTTPPLSPLSATPTTPTPASARWLFDSTAPLPPRDVVQSAIDARSRHMSMMSDIDVGVRDSVYYGSMVPTPFKDPAQMTAATTAVQCESPEGQGAEVEATVAHDERAREDAVLSGVAAYAAGLVSEGETVPSERHNSHDLDAGDASIEGERQLPRGDGKLLAAATHDAEHEKEDTEVELQEAEQEEEEGEYKYEYDTEYHYESDPEAGVDERELEEEQREMDHAVEFVHAHVGAVAVGDEPDFGDVVEQHGAGDELEGEGRAGQQEYSKIEVVPVPAPREAEDAFVAAGSERLPEAGSSSIANDDDAESQLHDHYLNADLESEADDELWVDAEEEVAESVTGSFRSATPTSFSRRGSTLSRRSSTPGSVRRNSTPILHRATLDRTRELDGEMEDLPELRPERLSIALAVGLVPSVGQERPRSIAFAGAPIEDLAKIASLRMETIRKRKRHGAISSLIMSE
ncbi:hypothetical protein BDK51DRAFT_27165, partial [Blyttiomyces helicus]